jgi:hypothetical protein
MILEAIRTAPGRFMTNIRNPKMRKNVAILMVGKMLGLAVVLLLMNMFMPVTATRAQDVATAVDGTQINAINTMWTLIAAFLVLYASGFCDAGSWFCPFSRISQYSC